MRIAFEAGLDSARDEAGVSALERGEIAVTSLTAQWLYSLCPQCRHTFRVGDRVKRKPGVGVVHCSPQLDCLGGSPSAMEGGTREITEFFAGLDEEWPPPQDVRVVVLEPGHPLLAPPRAGFRRKSCMVCSHTFRPLDLVVVCPCSPGGPLCEVGVHRDPVHGLACLEMWNPSGTNTHCPVTSRKLDDGE
jgi:hypothetical protein